MWIIALLVVGIALLSTLRAMVEDAASVARETSDHGLAGLLGSFTGVLAKWAARVIAFLLVAAAAALILAIL